MNALKKIASFFLLTAIFASFEVRSEIWVQVDSQGVAHFAPSRLDERYELFFKGAVADGSAPIQKPQSDLPIQSLKALKPRLAEFFDSSPRYRQIQPMILDAARKYRLDYELLQALVAAESAFNPQAVSSKGAIGLMQLMPDTARRFGVEGDRWSTLESKLMDPRLNLQLGARYLRLLIDMFPGRLDLALASYNAGEGAVQKAGKAIPDFKETQQYVVMVTQLYAVLKPPSAAPAPKQHVEKAFVPDFGFRASGEPYQLLQPGRGNMVAPIRNAQRSDSSNSVD